MSRRPKARAFLLERGVNGIKVGIGPGGGCTTRLTTNFGVPQVEALVETRLAVGDRVPLIADGGIKRDGGIAEALLFGGDSVMLGSAFAGTQETPGDIVLKSVLMPESQKVVQVPFKVFRGMASLAAVRDRLDLEEADAQEVEALGAEGLEVSVPARGSVRSVIHEMLKHLCSVDQLRRREQPVRTADRIPGPSGTLPDPALGGRANRVISALSQLFRRLCDTAEFQINTQLQPSICECSFRYGKRAWMS